MGRKIFVVSAIFLIGLAIQHVWPTQNSSSFNALLDVAERQLVTADYESADSTSAQVVDVAESLHGANSPEFGAALDLRVRVLLKKEGPGASDLDTFAERALEIREGAVPADPLQVAASLNTLARVRVMRADYRAALPLLERALRIREIHLGGDDLAVADSLNLLGSFFGRTGQREKAVSMLERALQIREHALGHEDPPIAETLEPLAMSLPTGDSRRADLLRRALRIREGAQGPEHPDIGVTLTYLGLVMRQQGHYDEAARLYGRALDLLKTAHGPKDYRVALTLNKLGVISMQKGDFISARKTYEECLAIRESVFGPEHPDVALTLNNLGIIDWETGRYKNAEDHLRRALAINRTALGNEHARVAKTLNNLAIVLELENDIDGALVALNEALAIRRQLPGGEASIAVGLHSLGRLVADPLEARRYLEQALSMRGELWGSDHRDYALTQAALGINLLETGDPGKGIELLEKGIETLRSRLGPGSHRVVENTIPLAMAYQRVGRSEDAFQTALKAEALARSQFRHSIGAFTEKEALQYASSRISGLDLALTLLNASDRPASADVRVLLDQLIRSRALVLDEVASRHPRYLTDTDPALIADVEQARERLARLAVEHLSAQPSDPLEEAEQALQLAERRLAEQSRDFRGRLQRFSVGADEVLESLGADAVLISYVRHRLPAENPGWNLSRPDVDARQRAYTAFVVRGADRQPVMVPLGSASTIDALIDGWKQRLREPQPVFSAAARESESRYRAVAHELRKRIWDPLLGEIGDTRLALVVPGGRLHEVSLGTLPNDADGYLAGAERRIHYLSAERDMVSSPTASPGNAALLVGGPDFGRSSGRTAVSRGSAMACKDLQQMQFEPLPASRTEVEEIAGLLSAREDAPTPVLLTGRDATEKAFKQRAAGRRLIHVATHGFFTPDACSSFLAASGERRFDRRGTFAANPLLLSGLAFAGVNRRDDEHRDPDDDDGILTAQEIASLDLSAVDWVVLSACETGIGQFQAHEGVLGLNRAFRIAGARTVLMSLWDVQDEPARRWMNALYRGRLDGLSTADAVRRASVEVIQERRRRKASTHPIFWGAFIASGDWR